MISKFLCRNHHASRCADVNFPPVVVDGCDQAGLVPPDIENGEFPDLVGMGKSRTDFLDAGKAPAAHLFEPVDQKRRVFRMAVSSDPATKGWR
jgi:hypothetical protein